MILWYKMYHLPCKGLASSDECHFLSFRLFCCLHLKYHRIFWLKFAWISEAGCSQCRTRFHSLLLRNEQLNKWANHPIAVSTRTLLSLGLDMLLVKLISLSDISPDLTLLLPRESGGGSLWWYCWNMKMSSCCESSSSVVVLLLQLFVQHAGQNFRQHTQQHIFLRNKPTRLQQLPDVFKSLMK